MRLHKSLMISALATAGVLGLVGCTDSGAPTDDSAAPTQEAVEFEAGTTMARLNEAGAVTIGTKFDQPLFGQVDANGEPQGFDVEIAKIIASELGIPESGITWTETVSANREPFIQSGEVDFVVATYTINDKRKEVISFAGPYYNAGQDILVLAGNPEGIEGPEDLAGKPVCTVAGSTSEANIAEYTDQITSLAGYADCLPLVSSGQVVALTTDNVILAGLADGSGGEFEVIGNPFTEEPYGIGLALDDTDFRMFINDVLEEAFEDGRWEAAWEKTAGTVLPLPEPPTIDRY
ncbi:glutamate ABC transporter substrate-binding protein [Antiquaquibacter soli]|uniref:Glutamate ABC transporter substrate-binding protein n=1 Tax=Antiquaquibacter soli TaxID=3064523 RepID=A0ABT9BQZ3_9MICO|nr:glutamate ABC transporter substrate-binding protein [Protaetiibacter sp. WY-16]MDO7881742.1 glutamate ABC transporter substrate-binding protein [Protaetiibacter sp. WY-16]